MVSSFLEKKNLLKLFHCISLSLFHLFPFLFYSFCVFTFFLVYVCFMFLILSIFIFFYFYVFIYFFSFFFFKKILVFLISSIMKRIFFLNCIFVWLDAGPPVFPRDFFNRNGTSRGPPQRLPWQPCPALFVTSSTGNGQWLEESSRHCPIFVHTDRQTPCLLLYIRCVGYGNSVWVLLPFG